MPDNKEGILQYVSSLIYKQTFSVEDFVRHMATYCNSEEVFNIIQRGTAKAFGDLGAEKVRAIIVYYQMPDLGKLNIVLELAFDVNQVGSGTKLGEIQTLVNPQGYITTIISTTRFV